MVKIIDIEGTDGCGKKTQTDLILKYLESKGYKCLMISFPNYDSPSSAPVKMYLNGELGKDVNCLNGYQASALFAVDRLVTIKKAELNKYDYVLFDRYTPSNMIHQAKGFNNNEEMVAFLKWLEDFEYVKLGLPKPDEIVFLDVPVDISLSLAHSRAEYKAGTSTDIHEEDEAYLRRCYENSKFVANMFNWKVVNCVENNKLQSIEAIHQKIKDVLGV